MCPKMSLPRNYPLDLHVRNDANNADGDPDNHHNSSDPTRAPPPEYKVILPPPDGPAPAAMVSG